MEFYKKHIFLGIHWREFNNITKVAVPLEFLCFYVIICSIRGKKGSKVPAFNEYLNIFLPFLLFNGISDGYSTLGNLDKYFLGIFLLIGLKYFEMKKKVDFRLIFLNILILILIFNINFLKNEKL